MECWAVIEVCSLIENILSPNPLCVMISMVKVQILALVTATKVRFEGLDCKKGVQYKFSCVSILHVG